MPSIFRNAQSTIKLAVIAALALLSLGVTRAEEPAEAFLEALRNEGYYDIALEYLEMARTDPNVSDNFKKSIDNERARVLIASVSGLRDAKLFNERLDEAQQLLARFAKSNPSVKTQAATLQYSGQVYSTRAEQLLKKAKSDRLTASERNQLLVQARGFLEQAQSTITQSKTLLERLLDPESDIALPIDPEDPSTLTELKLYRRKYTVVTRLLPEVVEKLADTYPEQDPNRQQLLKQAIDLYLVVFEKYRQKYAAGNQACVYAARCHQKLGNHKAALERLADIFALGNDGPLKGIKKEAFVLAAESWNKTTPYPHKDVIFVLDPAVRGLTRPELREKDWLRVQLELAIAKHIRAKEMKGEGGPASNSTAKTMDRTAAKLLRNVARIPSPVRDRAKQLLSEWNVPLTDVTAETVEPKSFDDALQVGRDKIAELEAIAMEASSFRRRIADAKDDATRRDLTTQLSETEAQLVATADSTITALERTGEFEDSETSQSDINTVRFLKCFVYFASRRYDESVAIGDFLLTTYPNENGSKQASNYTIQSLSQLLNQATTKGQDGSYELRELKRICDSVLSKFPGSNEAGLAASTMTKIALKTNDHVAGGTYFEKIPGDYSARGRLALGLGKLTWLDFKKRSRLTGPDQVDPAQLNAQLSQAVNFMQEGVSTISKDFVTYETAVGALMLVDALLEQGQVEDALRFLESTANTNAEATSIAPLDLIKMQHPSVSQGAKSEIFRQEAYKVAVKTYLAAMQKNSDQRQVYVDKASGVLEAMKEMADASNEPKAQARLTAVYQLIAAELRKGFDAIKSPDEKVRYANTLEGFLSSIQDGSQDAKIVFWAGTTMYGVADSLLASGKQQEAIPFMQKSIAMLNKAERLGFGSTPDTAKLSVVLKRDRALALRGSGKYKQAVDEFVKLMSTNKTPVSYQIHAAQTLQSWGLHDSNADAIAKATNGTGKTVDPQTKKSSNAIWGWKRLHAATATNKKYRDLFYTALYGIVEGRFEWGKIKGNKKAIKNALDEIAKERKRDAEFSGFDKWKQKFAELEARIKAAM